MYLLGGYNTFSYNFYIVQLLYYNFFGIYWKFLKLIYKASLHTTFFKPSLKQMSRKVTCTVLFYRKNAVKRKHSPDKKTTIISSLLIKRLCFCKILDDFANITEYRQFLVLFLIQNTKVWRLVFFNECHFFGAKFKLKTMSHKKTNEKIYFL